MAKKIRPEQMDALVEKLLASPAGQEMAEADRQETLAKRRAALSEIARLENERAEKLPPMQEESEKLARRVTFAEGQFKAARQKHGAAEFALYCARGEIEQAITRQRDILGASAPAELYEAIEQLTVEIFRTQGRFASRSTSETTIRGKIHGETSNKAEINRAVEALKTGIAELESLRLAEVDITSERIAAIVAKARARASAVPEVESMEA